MEDRCICCGEIIPEGQQVCKMCQEGSRMPKHIWNVFNKLNLAAGKSGIEVTEIRDKETGKRYRR